MQKYKKIFFIYIYYIERINEKERGEIEIQWHVEAINTMPISYVLPPHIAFTFVWWPFFLLHLQFSPYIKTK